MREIKFRAWLSDSMNRENEGMIYSDEIGMIKFFESFYSWTGNIKKIMQYTCLKDRHGKEIYEGDIVEFYEGDRAIVEWRDGKFILREIGAPHIVGFLNDYDIKVVGNIYENPGLLKEAQAAEAEVM